MVARKVIAADSETDPFLADRVPEPFIWGAWDGSNFRTFNTALELLECYKDTHCYIYMHNGGKFDFHLLLDHLEETRVQIIGSRIVELKYGKAILRDSFALMPEALSSYAKTKIEYWKLERHCRREHWDEIVAYLRDDCVYLFDLVKGFFNACNAVGNSNTYRSTVASNAMQVARRMGLGTKRTNHHFDAVFRPFYFGGRTECFSPGIYEDIDVFDIKSAYPFAMCHSMPTGGDYIVTDDPSDIKDGEEYTCFYDITCRSNGCFPFIRNNALCFDDILGRFNVSGWEFMSARRHGLLKDFKINRIYKFVEFINHEPYVMYWFDKKQEAEDNGDKLQRLISKRMMNSLYGKYAQNPVNYFDYKICIGGTPVNYDEGWQLDSEFNGKELHARPVLWRYKQRALKEGDEDGWRRFPIHYNVATAASITGFCRSMLLDTIALLGRENVLYCDTDSVFCKPVAATRKLRQDGKLGAWEWEGLANPVGLAGKKLYALRFVNGPNSGKEKLASKGAKLTFDQIMRVCDGETVQWRNQAPTFSLGNKPRFVVRNIRATAHKTNQT